jgi:hypothetical protein
MVGRNTEPKTPTTQQGKSLSFSLGPLVMKKRKDHDFIEIGTTVRTEDIVVIASFRNVHAARM